jgi:long-chain acyl-CoA synthetase
MPATRFHWHPQSRAFAGVQEVIPKDGPSVSGIPVSPVDASLDNLRRTLGTATPFCVSETPPLDLDRLSPDTFATLTGGTSGRPKVIVRSQASWVRSFESNAAQLGYTPADSIAVLGALSHSLALYGVLEALHLGLDIHALCPLGLRATSARMAAQRCTILYATPTQLRLLPAGTLLPDLRLIFCGGGALTDAVRRHIRAVAPNASLHCFYGAAETSFVTMSDAGTPDASVGRAYPRVEIDVRNPDATGTGLIWVRSPYLFEHYLEGGSPHTMWEGDWLSVGEYGRLDAQGYLYLRGRAGRMVNITDIAVFPEELEAQLGGLAGVDHCAVLARFDQRRGTRLIAVVSGPDSPHLRDLILSHCDSNTLIRPREVVFLDPFPLLPSGKPDLPCIAALTGCSL